MKEVKSKILVISYKWDSNIKKRKVFIATDKKRVAIFKKLDMGYFAQYQEEQVFKIVRNGIDYDTGGAYITSGHGASIATQGFDKIFKEKNITNRRSFFLYPEWFLENDEIHFHKVYDPAAEHDFQNDWLSMMIGTEESSGILYTSFFPQEKRNELNKFFSEDNHEKFILLKL